MKISHKFLLFHNLYQSLDWLTINRQWIKCLFSSDSADWPSLKCAVFKGDTDTNLFESDDDIRLNGVVVASSQ